MLLITVQSSKQSDSQGSDGSYSGRISPVNSSTELGSSREVTFAADLSCVVNDAGDDHQDMTAQARHRTLSWNTSCRSARKYDYIWLFIHLCETLFQYSLQIVTGVEIITGSCFPEVGKYCPRADERTNGRTNVLLVLLFIFFLFTHFVC